MKIVITGAAGLVGQNLNLMLKDQGFGNIVAIDKHKENLAILKKYNPEITIVEADLSVQGQWSEYFKNANCVIMLHAQITGTQSSDFIRNNIIATLNVIHFIKQYNIPYIIHVSSSVVNSVIRDCYSNTKMEQENLILNSGIKYCVLRPTLMFGWFDPKHLGWLSRFMEKMPIFPIPGNGKYLRQPLYCRDFCKIIVTVMENQPANQVFDIVGKEQIDYIDIIRLIKKTKKIKTKIIKIPYLTFYLLLKISALINKKPPFTADQLNALCAGDYFSGIDVTQTFGIKQTPFFDAIDETFNHPIYSNIYISR